MRQVSRYQGCTRRTFKEALIHLLEEAYGLLGSRRVLSLLAEDVEQLVTMHYPAPERLSSGWMVFTATRGDGGKRKVGRTAGDYDLITLAWPVITPEDLQTLCTLPKGEVGRQARRRLYKARLRRLIEYGLAHPQGPALLTQVDLSLMVGISVKQVRDCLQELRQETGEPLPTMGYHYDLGMQPTHKREIIALYEAGVDEAEIARRTAHAQGSVGRYIRDYERVKLLLVHGTAPLHVASLANLRPSVAEQHMRLVQQYHPELFAQSTAPEE